MRDHDPITVRDFLGTFDRGDDDSVSPGFFKDSRNVRFFSGGVKSREGTSLDVTIGSVQRMAIYKRIGEAQRLLLLDNSGQLWDSTNLVTPILSIVAMVDFSVETMFNRAYITPHDGHTGLPGEKVYVYDGSGTARPAAGDQPTGFNLVAVDSAGSGNCENTTKVFAVCYESASGFLTKPGGFVAFTPAGGKSVDLSAIHVGPSSTVARQLVCTQAIQNFNGDFQNQEYFIVPSGRIADNVTTTKTVSFFDADLQGSVDYLMDQLDTIPAGVGIKNYRGRLCVWGENLNPALVRVSTSGQPESFDAVEGFATINPGDSGGGVLNCAVYRTQLVCFKDGRAYATTDNGQNAAFWEVDDIDMSVGTSCHGLARIRDYGESTEDRLFLASRQGLQLFNGTFSDTVVSFAVDNIWARITAAYFHTVEVIVDPIEYLVYIAVPLDGATSPNHLLVADYQEGMDTIKWTIWDFNSAPTTIAVDVDFTTKTSEMKFGSSTGSTWKLDPTTKLDAGQAISAYVRFGLLPFDEEGNLWHFTGARFRIKGSGTLDLTIYGEDDALTVTPASLTLGAAPGQNLIRGFDFTNEQCALKIAIARANEWFSLTKYVLYAAIVWETRPE